MSEANKIDYTGVVNAARRGDEDAYEILYNESLPKCRAICMKYFDTTTEEGRRKVDDTVREVYVAMYDRLKKLYDPADFPILGRSLTRDCCLKRAKSETVQLQAESYIGVADAEDATAGLEPLVTADACRSEVRKDAMLSHESIGTLVLSVLREMTGAQRLAIVRWNENDPDAMKYPDVLRDAFICAEKSVMALEEETGLRARDYAKSRLAFFNWLLDLYNRFYEVPAKDWEALTAEDDVETPLSFHTIWDDIRARFYITNTIQLPKGMLELHEDRDDDLSETGFSGYLDEAEPDDESDASEEQTAGKAKSKKGFLGTWWGRLLVGLLIIVLALVAIVVTAGQHTSHALTPAFMQYADFRLEQVFEFNIS